MIIIQAKLRGIKEFVTGIRLVFQIPNTVLTEEQKISIIQANGKDGYMTFGPDELKAEIEAIMRDKKIGVTEAGKSRSEILRGTLYDYWKKNYSGAKPFDDFYNDRMDSYIIQIKQTIDQLDIDRLDDYYKPKTTKND